jgi:murein DD-endopeptidase MepM/ murein hydrolase activator NlpD
MGQVMPDVQATVQRAGTFYNATIRAGVGMTRGQMQQATLQGLRGGLTAPGSDANVANYLAGRGMAANTSYNSTYQQTIRGVGSAAKYLNMGNEQAAAAIEGLTSGQGSGNFLNRYGILTSDMATGKEKTQGQIFNEMANKLSMGDATEEEVLDSLRRGNLGVELANSGMTADQQAMFSQFMIERARGNNMDLSDPEAMAKMMDKAKEEGNENPFLPGYDLNTAKTDAMGGAEGQYIAGIKAATKALEGLAKAGGAAASLYGAPFAAGSMFSSDTLGQGAMNMIGGIGNVISGVGQAALSLIFGGDNTVGNASASGGRKGAPVGGDSSTSSNASAGGDSSSQGAFKLVHPVNPAKITARFGQKTSSYTPGKIVWPNGHKGVDYEAKAGQTVYAAAGGTVLSTSGGGELGNYALIDHGNGYFTFYCHLTSVTASGTVKTGQPVGTAGNTGTKSSGVHLHFALSKSRSTADAIDPEPFLSGAASSVPASNPDQSSSGSGDVSGSSSSSSSSVESSSAGASSSGSPILTTGVSGYSAAPSASGSSSVEGVAPWTAGSVASGATGSTSTAGTAGAGEGGDGYTGGSSDGYLSATGGSNAATLSQRKSRGGNTNNVTINLTVASASDDEARRFAVMVKRTLEEESMMMKMARA